MTQKSAAPQEGAANNSIDMDDRIKPNPFVALIAQREAKSKAKSNGKVPAEALGPQRASTAPTAPTADWCRGVEVLPVKDRTLKFLLHTIARSVAPDGTTTFLGRSHLALAVGVSQDHITRLKQKAHKLGFLDYKARSSQTGRRHDKYTLRVRPVTPKEYDDVAARVSKGESQNDIYTSLCATRYLGSRKTTSEAPQNDISDSAKRHLEVGLRKTTPWMSPESPEEQSPKEESPPFESPPFESPRAHARVGGAAGEEGKKKNNGNGPEVFSPRSSSSLFFGELTTNPNPNPNPNTDHLTPHQRKTTSIGRIAQNDIPADGSHSHETESGQKPSDPYGEIVIGGQGVKEAPEASNPADARASEAGEPPPEPPELANPANPANPANQEERLAELGHKLLVVYAEADSHKHEELLKMREASPELGSDHQFGLALVHMVRLEYHESTITGRLRQPILDSYAVKTWEAFMRMDIAPPSGLVAA